MPPITPDEVSAKKAIAIPEEVFDAFNELIAKNWNGRDSVVKQDDVLAAILSRLWASGKLSADHIPAARQAVFDNRWLDVESAYEAVGWKVVYDKPAYCESHPPTFKFSRGK